MSRHDLFGTLYDASEVAVAIRTFNFTDRRKNWERGSFVKLPREEARGRHGAKYHAANIYEYGLLVQAERVVSRAAASSVVYTAFESMKRTAESRISRLPEKERNAIRSTRTFSQQEDLWDFGGFIDHPRIYFNPDFLDRSANNALYWVFDTADVRPDPKNSGSEVAYERDLIMVRGGNSLDKAFKDLRKSYDTQHPGQTSKSWSAFGVLNVTDTLRTIDFMLEGLLDARMLERGESL